MEVFRIAKEDYQELDGIGGLFYPGRWHEKGNRVIYTSEHRSLAAFEALVHISKPIFLSINFVLISVFIPDQAVVQEIPLELLQPGWDNYEYKLEIQKFGTHFLKEKNHLLLKVPSAIIKHEFNYIINPLHPLFKECKTIQTESFLFDNRLM
jgi:RES domain-containing protein